MCVHASRNMRKLLVIIACTLAFVPSVASAAAWVATDNFEVASTGNWAGVSTGSGFSANWGAVVGGVNASYQIVSSPVGEATRGAALTATNNGSYIQRTLTTSFSTGSIYFLIRRNSTSASNGARTRMPTAGGMEYDVGFYGSSIILFANSGQKTVCSGLSANTWYEVQIEFDTTVPQHRARCRTQLGSWNAFTAQWEPNGGTTPGNITALGFQALGTDGTITYFDRISDTEETAAATTVFYSTSSWWFLFF